MRQAICFAPIAVLILFSTLTVRAQTNETGQAVITYWFGTQNDGSTFVLEQHEFGRLKFIPASGMISEGTWKQNENRVDIELNNGFARLNATIEGDHLRGSATGRRGAHWSWSAAKQPRVLSTSAPAYPALARAARINGSVIVDVEVDASGVVNLVRAVQGHPMLRDVSKDAAKHFRFMPVANERLRTARICFTFRQLDVDERTTSILSPLILSPYQIEIRRGYTLIEKELSSSER